MFFYSALVLAANTELRNPTPERARVLFDQLGLIRPDAPDYGVEHGLDNLAADITALLEDHAAQNENKNFFAPDSIGLYEKVEVQGQDCGYTGKRWSVRIHGNGYLFPWDLGTVRARIIANAKLERLRIAMREQFGGQFRWPFRRRALRERLIDGEDGWVWFMSESL